MPHSVGWRFGRTQLRSAVEGADGNNPHADTPLAGPTWAGSAEPPARRSRHRVDPPRSPPRSPSLARGGDVRRRRTEVGTCHPRPRRASSSRVGRSRLSRAPRAGSPRNRIIHPALPSYPLDGAATAARTTSTPTAAPDARSRWPSTARDSSDRSSARNATGGTARPPPPPTRTGTSRGWRRTWRPSYASGEGPLPSPSSCRSA